MGQGHIQRKVSKRTGKATYQARIPSPLNPRKDIVKTFKLKGDAERWLTDQASKINHGEYQAPTKQTFTDATDIWRRTRGADLAPKTSNRYEGIIKNYLLPAFGATPIPNLTRPVIKTWFANLDVTPAQAKKVHTVLSSILSEAVEMGLIRENPAARMRLASAPRRPMVILTAAEVRKLADAMADPSDRLAIYVAGYTGIRPEEMWALQRKHVILDPEKPRIIIERTVTEVSGHLFFREMTKTSSSRRMISLPTFLTNLLAEHLKGKQPDDLVFTSHGGANGRKTGDGGPVRHTNFRKRSFVPAVERALGPEKQEMVPYDLRHTHVSLLAQAGASIILVSKRLGHAKPSMTLDVYLHLFPSDEVALAGTLDQIYTNVVPLEKAA